RDSLSRGVLIVRGDRGNRLALVANLVNRQQWFVRRDAERLEVPVDVLRDVLRRDDRTHARQRLCLARVELLDRGMVMRRTQRLRPERAAHADVVHVLRAAGDVCNAVVAGKSCADGLHAGLPGINTSASSGSKLGSTRSGWTSPLAAASTAATILT